MRTFDAILFDMDGTLVDSEQYHAQAWTRLMERFGRRPEAHWLDVYVGTTDTDTVTGILKTYPGLAGQGSAADILEMKQELFRALIAENGATLAMPGIVTPLRELSANGVPMAVGTNGVLANCRAVLKAAGLLQFFATLSTFDQVERGKPEPDIYLAAAERLGVAPDRCVVVEDSETGAKSGRAAGCFVAGVATSQPPQDLSAADKIFPTTVGALDWIIERLQ